MPKHIDTDVLKEWIENWLYKDRYYHNGRIGKTIPITELYDILEQMPTADVPDRKVGEWIEPTSQSRSGVGRTLTGLTLRQATSGT